MTKASLGTRAFLVFWYVQWIGWGALWSVLQTFVWSGIVWMLLVGNHMATGSWILRGLKDWP